MIAEQTLERGRSEGFLRRFEEAATILLIYCQVTRQTSIERFAARVDSPSRRNVTDGEILRGLRSGAIDHARFEPLDPPDRALLLDCENLATEAWERTYLAGRGSRRRRVGVGSDLRSTRARRGPAVSAHCASAHRGGGSAAARI